MHDTIGDIVQKKKVSSMTHQTKVEVVEEVFDEYGDAGEKSRGVIGRIMNEEDLKKDLEDDLIGLVGKMKSIAKNYKEQLNRDSQVDASLTT